MNKGILAGIGAYIFWGLFPIYWRLLEEVPAIEILANRMVWSFVFMAIILTVQKDWEWFREASHNRKTLLTYTLAAILLSINWFTYIWAVNAGFVVEASLGYFINPLVNILLGVIFLGEKLRRGQIAAVILAGLGVVYLTVSYGSLPWISLVLAFTFGMYGLIKKTARLESMHGFSLETTVLFLPALFFLLYREVNGVDALVHQGPAVTLLLVLAGPVTSIPLLLFGYSARRIPLSMLGFIQYIAPTLQFMLGVFVYAEPFPPTRLVGFSIIWLALLVYSLESVFYNRKEKP
jgi:chloramphenicol-sensitive protein RarD